jgi:hypothetical protein
VLTIGTGFGNARFTNLRDWRADPAALLSDLYPHVARAWLST